MFKKLMSVLMTFVLIFTAFTNSVIADDNEDSEENACHDIMISQNIIKDTESEENRLEPTDDTDYSLVQRNNSSIISGFSGAMEASEQDIYLSQFHIKEINSTNIIEEPTRAYWIQLSNMSSFSYFAQETSYSCGPACVKMALKYLTGTTYYESIIRNGCYTSSTSGTTLYNMASYINSRQSINNYVERYGQTKAQMKTDLYVGINSCDAPPIIGVKELDTLGWPFNLSAHFVTVYSIKSDKSEVAVADPWAGYVNSNSPYKCYDITTDNLYLGYNSVNCGYMY